MIYPLHSRNTKKLKNQKPKLLIFFVNTGILIKLFQKKAKIIIPFFMKNSKNNNIILVLVLVFNLCIWFQLKQRIDHKKGASINNVGPFFGFYDPPPTP